MRAGHMVLETLIGITEIVLGTFGALFIVYGAAIAMIELLAREMRIRAITYHDIRWVFTTRILIGLEFFVAADVLKTILEPTLQDLAILGALVTIRTVVSYFLGKEVSELPEERKM
jgi:Predicted membrane protein